MTEVLFAMAVVTLAAGGLGLGLILGRGAPRTSCGAADGVARPRCADCPLRKRKPEADAR